ncbi:MAG: hypothetical protein ACI30V_07735 [Muribaculaceae bacterium]
MKKFLLLGAAAMLAGSVNAQTITGKMTLDWEHSMGSYTTGVTRSIGQLGKQALVLNHTNGTVEVWDATGKVKEYAVNTWLTENKATINADDEAAYTMGRGVSTDEAGNIIVNLQFGGATSSLKFVAIKPDGTMKYIGCEFPGGLGATNGRMDHLGDKMAGDMFNNGFIVAIPNALQYAVVYNIFEGEQDMDFSYGVKIGAEDNTESWPGNEGSAIFLEPLAADAEQAPKFIVRHRSLGGYRLSADGKSALEKISLPDGTTLGFGGATTSNFSAFTVGDKSYVVGNQPDPNNDNARTHYWEVKEVSTGETVATWSMPTGEAPYYMVGFASSVNEDGSVNIYQFNPGIRLAKYTLAADFSGINNVIADADENAPVEYYNLQGVKVEKPENGIFIKKQGAKATKIIAE